VDNILSEIEKDTVFWFTHFYRGANSVLKKDDEKAVKHFSNVKGDSYLYLQPWQRIGGILYDGKLYKESAFVFNEAYLNFPEDFLVNFFLGLSYALMGNYSASEPFLLKSTQLNPSEVNTYSAYAFSLSRLKKSDEAIINYRKALNIDPKNPELLNSLAIIYEGMSDYSISDSLYLQALKNDPKNALACNNYAYSLAKRSEKLDEALRMAELALSIDPNSPSYMDTYGWVQFKLGNFTVAKEYIEKALAMDGQNNELLDHYGDVMFKLGDKKTAIIFWKKALELNKDNQTIKMKIERGEI
jgi:tetratricopeptide (TPR) repeat protein